MSHPFDSFNVEDLHTVDLGVIENIFPLLHSPDKWDFIVGHFLGVDHVGHRLGPSHPTMKSKLRQMDKVLRRVVDLIGMNLHFSSHCLSRGVDDETLLVVLGDHGMDRKGDHGGDGIYETSSALWIYSKGTPLFTADSEMQQEILYPLQTTSHFPNMAEPFRSVQQIDLVPSFALLLGLPIPHNNLGTVIPELFMREENGRMLLFNATRLNAEQMDSFLNSYYSSPSGKELYPHWHHLSSSFTKAMKTPMNGNNIREVVGYLRLGLATCRQLWAQFDSFLMFVGLGVMAGSLMALGGMIAPSSYLRTQSNAELQHFSQNALLFGLAAGVSGAAICSVLPGYFGTVHGGLAASAIAVILFSCYSYSPFKVTLDFSPSTIIYLLHFASFFSNSFIFWEEKIVTYFLSTLVAYPMLAGLTTLQPRLRMRLIGFSLLLGCCVRLASISTVCREEQQPYCTVTFYSSSGASAPPPSMALASLVVAVFLPLFTRQFLKISRSDSGSAPVFLEVVFRCLLVVGTICWLLEYGESVSFLGTEYDWLLRRSRSIISRFGIAGATIAGPCYWKISFLCISVVRKEPTSAKGKVEIQLFGYANAFGSSYLLLVTLLFSLLYISTQLTGQVVLALSMIGMLSWLEIVDTLKDGEELKRVGSKGENVPGGTGDTPSQTDRPLTFSETIPLSLLGLHMFYGTGHQATLQSIQWKTGFVLTEKLAYPFSPVTVAINTFGPQLFASFASSLIALWNVPPLPYERQAELVERNALLSFLALSAYYATLLLGSAGAAALLRRHLMVWKVFAPRFMAAAATMVAVDLGGAAGVIFALTSVLDKVSQAFA